MKEKNDELENKQVTLSNKVTLTVQDFPAKEDSPATMSTVNCCYMLGMAPPRMCDWFQEIQTMPRVFPPVTEQ